MLISYHRHHKSLGHKRAKLTSKLKRWIDCLPCTIVFILIPVTDNSRIINHSKELSYTKLPCVNLKTEIGKSLQQYGDNDKG